MRFFIESLNRSSIILVLFLSFGISCFEEDAALKCSRSNDCFLSALKSDVLANANPCDDFFYHACGVTPVMHGLYQMIGSQEAYFRRRYQLYFQDGYGIELNKFESSDTELVKLIKLYYQLCANWTYLREEGVKPIVKFLSTVPYDSSWWELEKWAVSNGFDSTLFSVKVSHHYGDQGSIMLLHPDTRSLQDNYSKTSRNMVTKLQEAGLNTTMANRLLDGITKEKELHSNTTVVADVWDNPNPGSPTNITQHDWEEYLETYWNSVMNTDGMVPVLKNGRFKVVAQDLVSIREYARILGRFTDDNIKNIILWRMVVQLVDYASQETRDVLEVLPAESCLTPPMESALRKNYWYGIIPTSVRRSIKKMYQEIDLQGKLLTYKELTKVPHGREPLTPREQKHLKRLVEEQLKVKKIVDSLKRELRSSKALLKKMEDFKEPVQPHLRPGATATFAEYQSKIPKLRERIPVLESHFNATSAEHDRRTTRLNDFRTKNKDRMSLAATVHGIKTNQFQNNTRHRRYPAFPFEDTITRLKSIIQPPAADANYVELALSLKKWERSMILQLPEKFGSRIEDDKFVTSGFTELCYARFQNHRPLPVNYGSLGSVLGYEISQGLREPIIDAITGTRLQTYFISNILGMYGRHAHDWRNDLKSFLKSNLSELFIWGGEPILESMVERFLKENSDPAILDLDALNATEWLAVVYNAVNTEMGLKAAWNGYRRDLKLNGENEETLTCYKKYNIFPPWTEDMLFFQAFGYMCTVNTDAIRLLLCVPTGWDINWQPMYFYKIAQHDTSAIKLFLMSLRKQQEQKSNCDTSDLQQSVFNALVQNHSEFYDVYKDHPKCKARPKIKLKRN